MFNKQVVTNYIGKNKFKIFFFPFYLLYIFVFVYILGVSKDIWDDVTKNI